MMQNSNPKTVTPAFNQAASLSEEDQLRLKVAALKSPLLDRAYRRLEREEQKKQDEIHERFEKNREPSVEAMKRDLIDKKNREHHPELKPKHLPTVTREQLAKEAERNARLAYAAQQKAAIEQARQESLKEKRAFIADVTRPERLKDQFNQAARGNAR
ncbi:hypothetical protein JIN85_14000 [Luteolibacter pohnpeiensis]|uniref:Uncharacterized protein n=1 Tax=Luteolibacter pohnpeiensis TaxID=454153 RepID=A0A934VXI1_9BACT|nr:hypothetical protein [Luteolibacter pohnpeiensis]MBK1883534.1 hypothetical protein [Luteolibacter pohnpeiensis]